MQYRTFGRTGWEVSEIGFGGWQLGGTWGKVEDSESIETLLYSFEHGVNFVDTAIAYGNGRSETVVGKAIKEWKNNKIYVATKIAPLMPALTTLNVDQKPEMRGRYPSWYLRQLVEGSLKRLQVERIDLLQLHLWLERGTEELDWLETLNALRQEGKIDRIGVSLPDIKPDHGINLAKYGLVDSIQVMFNIFEQEPSEELFPSAKQSNVAIISRVPFDSGSLTGSWDKSTFQKWHKQDKRHHMYKGGRFEETLIRIDKLKAIFDTQYPDLAEAAMRFVLYHEAISVVIPGMRNKHEVDLNLGYSDNKMMPSELIEILKPHDWKHNFY